MSKTSADGAAKKPDAPLMPLFYKKPTPLDAKVHANLALKKDFGLGFTKGVNAVPVNLIELPQILNFLAASSRQSSSISSMAFLKASPWSARSVFTILASLPRTW